jgi:hypothetical protein
MTKDPRIATNAASRARRQDGIERPGPLRRAAALLKNLFADPTLERPVEKRGKTSESHDGVFQPPRY